MANVLVAGGAGFIGSHLIDRLLERGDTVVCVDDLSTGTAKHTQLYGDSVRYTFLEANVCEPGLPEFVRTVVPQRFDVVFHLASPASPLAYLAHPIETLDVGSRGTHRLLEIARIDSARFVLASTSEVYGDPLEHPQAESYNGNVDPVALRSVYDEAKRFAEAITMAYARTHGVSVAIARIFNTYGPRMRADDGRVVTNFVYQSLAGKPLTIYGGGVQTRSFCYVDDQVSGLLALLDSGETGPINIGNPAEVSIRELADLVIELTRSPSPIEFHPAPIGDPLVRQPDITLARRLLGWQPAVGLRDGLSRTIDDYRSVRNT